MEILHISFHDAKRILDSLDQPRFEIKQKSKGKLVVPKDIGDLRIVHKRYLSDRNFDWREIRRIWKICGIGLSSRLSWRIWIPIHYHGEVVSWTTRAISDKVVRYISAGEKEESMAHKELLYGEDFVRHAIIVVEGVTDVWKIGPGAVATFGSGYSTQQLARIARYPTRAICFDNEPEAQKRANRLVRDLSVLPGDTYNVRLDAKDAADESRENIEQLRREILS
jgi:hypothetical protein